MKVLKIIGYVFAGFWILDGVLGNLSGLAAGLGLLAFMLLSTRLGAPCPCAVLQLPAGAAQAHGLCRLGRRHRPRHSDLADRDTGAETC
jgi:hypothetical protein